MTSARVRTDTGGPPERLLKRGRVPRGPEGAPYERATRFPDAATLDNATSGSGPREWTLRT